MTEQGWLAAAGQYDQAEADKQARREKERAGDAERGRQAAQLTSEIKEAAGQLQRWMGTEEYQVALQLLNSGGQYDFKAVYLGSEEGAPTSSYSRVTATESVAKEGPKSRTSYYLGKKGFAKRKATGGFTYHGEYEGGDDIVSVTSPEEVVRAVVTTHGKKPSEALAFIREELDKIAEKAPEQKL